MAGRLVGREPVMTVSTVIALLIAVLPIFGWTSEIVGTVSAALVVLGGAVSAALLSIDRLLPLLVGVGKAVLAVVAAFGLHVPDNYVAALMAVLTVVGGLVTRPQVGAVEPPRDRHGGIIAVRGVLDTFDTTFEPAERVEHVQPPQHPARGPHEAHTEILPATPDGGPDGGEGERGGEGRHAHRGWIAGRLRPNSSL